MSSISVYSGIVPSFASTNASSPSTVTLTYNSDTDCYNAPTTIDAYYSALVARNEGKEVMPQTVAIPRKPPNYQNYEGRILC